MGRSRSLVYGVGVNDHEGVIHVNGKSIPSYAAWTSMMQRCYSTKRQAKQPTHIGCSVCSEWLSFTKFKNWYDLNYREGFQLDKDLLVQGNKQYSPQTCNFVPRQLNNLFSDHAAARGEYPQGVNWHKSNGKFEAKLNINGKRNNLGYFTSVQEASNAYQAARHAYVLNEISRYRQLYPDNKPLMILIDRLEARI